MCDISFCSCVHPIHASASSPWGQLASWPPSKGIGCDNWIQRLLQLMKKYSCILVTCSSCHDCLKGLAISFATSHSDVQWAVFSELSEPFMKIPLLWFTRSKDLGNEILRELWQKEGWLGSKWKGLLPCNSSCCTGSEELAKKGLELFWHLHYQGGAWMLHQGNTARAPRVESSNRAECVRLPWP